jgi:catechol 2,3-dioxygenase-like lactoylglutathione lyase family enzyme
VQMPTAVEPGLEFVVTATLIVAEVGRSVAFYRDVLGAEVLRTGDRHFCAWGIWGSRSTSAGGQPTINLT